MFTIMLDAWARNLGCTYKVALFAGGDYRPIDLVV